MANVELKEMVVGALEDKKGADIQSLDVVGQTDVTDFMIIVSGGSNRQVKALAQNVIDEARVFDIRPLGVEGMEEGDWVLIDLADVVVHVMLPQVREFYDLERLWSMSSTEDARDTQASIGLVDGSDQ